MKGRYFAGHYWRVLKRGHPRADKGGFVYEHVLVAEKNLGRFLLPEEEVHHEDEVKTNNSPGNIKVFSSHSEHMAAQRRQRALRECGHADWMKCGYCGEYDAPSNLYVYTPRRRQPRGFHTSCKNSYERRRYAESH
jgi:hypothetical protein